LKEETLHQNEWKYAVNIERQRLVTCVSSSRKERSIIGQYENNTLIKHLLLHILITFIK